MSALSRSTGIILVVAVLAATAGLLLGGKLPVATGDAPTLAHGLAYPAPRPLAPFALARADGAPFTREDLVGRWSLVFVGFTHCPDVCPTTLGTFKQVEPLLATEAPELPVSLVFVSVDPERDDAEQLRNYAAYFSPSIVAATGTKSELDTFTRQLGVLYAKVATTGADYTIDHSTQIALIDPEARLTAIFRPPHDAAGIVADLRALAEARP
jgi:protein SCO1